ncbi:hypothetical protein JKI95_10055 [Corynebacterium aquatimens]|uniref:hypothetical protein n=1 Tax=Corynebacterium TaxID=1716 RepID=UPI001F46D1EE|nr:MULTISPECIES: hypothetical protein [Corynebacterium]QYH19424.1 hypothetical protein JKI95_10055 [Corynebacterium aquatimens]UIZ91655.1 hypothetical protein JZY91_07880 [Corynebacterium sp. CNCTC7651]
MKKPALALSAAAALTLSVVVATPALAEQDPAAGEAASSEFSSSETELSAGAIVGITLGVLALVAGGSFWAVQQGIVQLPQGIAKQFGLPGAKAQRGSCEAQEFDSAVPGWPGPLGTTVMYCDGQFAKVGAAQSDWVEHFRFVNGAWSRIQPDGKKQPADYVCFNSYKLRDMGAPEEFIRVATICTPEEIGR